MAIFTSAVLKGRKANVKYLLIVMKKRNSGTRS
jgi:hypothetical protein